MSSPSDSLKDSLKKRYPKTIADLRWMGVHPRVTMPAKVGALKNGQADAKLMSAHRGAGPKGRKCDSVSGLGGRWLDVHLAVGFINMVCSTAEWRKQRLTVIQPALASVPLPNRCLRRAHHTRV